VLGDIFMRMVLEIQVSFGRKKIRGYKRHMHKPCVSTTPNRFYYIGLETNNYTVENITDKF